MRPHPTGWEEASRSLCVGRFRVWDGAARASVAIPDPADERRGTFYYDYEAVVEYCLLPVDLIGGCVSSSLCLRLVM